MRSITISQWTQWESVLAGTMLSISCNLHTHTISWENCQWLCQSLHEILLSYHIWEAEGSLERENKLVKKWERTRIELLRWRQTKLEREKVAELLEDWWMIITWKLSVKFSYERALWTLLECVWEDLDTSSRIYPD